VYRGLTWINRVGWTLNLGQVTQLAWSRRSGRDPGRACEDVHEIGEITRVADGRHDARELALRQRHDLGIEIAHKFEDERSLEGIHRKRLTCEGAQVLSRAVVKQVLATAQKPQCEPGRRHHLLFIEGSVGQRDARALAHVPVWQQRGGDQLADEIVPGAHIRPRDGSDDREFGGQLSRQLAGPPSNVGWVQMPQRRAPGRQPERTIGDLMRIQPRRCKRAEALWVVRGERFDALADEARRSGLAVRAAGKLPGRQSHKHPVEGWGCPDRGREQFPRAVLTDAEHLTELPNRYG
jgi:hypothetical protein